MEPSEQVQCTCRYTKSERSVMIICCSRERSSCTAERSVRILGVAETELVLLILSLALASRGIAKS